MGWLNAILAFSLAMIVFCTITSAVTEIAQEIRKRRQKGLEWMLKRLYREVLQPYASQISGNAIDAETDLSDFLSKTAKNIATEDKGTVRLSSLPFTDFVERLAETRVGQNLLAAAQAKAKDVQGDVATHAEKILADVGRAFGRYEADATAYFASRARWYTVVISVILAFVLNVDAVRLFSAFVADRNLTQAMLARADAITATPQVGGAAAPADLDAKLANLREQLKGTTTMGLPIGIRYFPWCHDEAAIDPNCKGAKDAKGWGYFLLICRWFVCVALAGVLIGLGGPFWFDIYSKLSKLMQTKPAIDAESPPAAAATLPVPAAGTRYPNAPSLAPFFVAAAELARQIGASPSPVVKVTADGSSPSGGTK